VTKTYAKKYPDLARDNTSDAEAQGFEPRVPSQVRLISSQVHSTALPNLLSFIITKLRIKNQSVNYEIKFLKSFLTFSLIGIGFPSSSILTKVM
jgi:hypothetical protein